MKWFVLIWTLVCGLIIENNLNYIEPALDSLEQWEILDN